MVSTTGDTLEILQPEQWQARERAHRERADSFTHGRLERRARGERHPVDDFLFEYYPFTPGQLRRWHPGIGVGLAGAEGTGRADWRDQHLVTAGGEPVVTVDVAAYLQHRERTVRFVRELLSETLARPGRFSCFGLHEWAMVYRLTQDDVRHEAWPLRLGHDGTDAVVESHTIACSHFDAYRFFTPDALGRNTIRPTLETRTAMEQQGCLHAGMDVYKWAGRLGPAVPGELWLDAFELAREIRTLDMQASPYDLAGLGLEPVAIETPEGKAEYAARQRAFVPRANALRRRLLDVCEALLAGAGSTRPLT